MNSDIEKSEKELDSFESEPMTCADMVACCLEMYKQYPLSKLEVITESDYLKALELYRQYPLSKLEGTAESDYLKALEVFGQRLNDEQKRWLDEMEAAQHRNFVRSATYAAHRGFCDGFSLGPAPEKPGYKYIHRCESFFDGLGNFSDYHNDSRLFRKLYKRLYKQLDAELREHMVSIKVFWADRLYGVFFLCYGLGRNHAGQLRRRS